MAPTLLSTQLTLLAHRIPPHFSTLPNLHLAPIPHIPLPPPHAAYCLTNYLPTDAAEIHRIVTHPLVSPGLSATKRSRPFGVDDAERKVKGWLEAMEGWCFPQIRLIAELSNPSPGLVGNVSCRRDDYHRVPGPEGERLMAQVADKRDREVHWDMALFMDPAHGGKGVMTAATLYLLEHFFRPHISSFPGQLTSSWFKSNSASAALHRKLGFRPVAQTPWSYVRDGVESRYTITRAVWQGGGEVGKAGSLWRDLDDYEEAQEGAKVV